MKLHKPVLHFQISILSPDYSDVDASSSRVAAPASRAKANVTVGPGPGSDRNELVLLVTGMAPGRRYPVRVAAVNAKGIGPSAEGFLVLVRENCGFNTVY